MYTQKSMCTSRACTHKCGSNILFASMLLSLYTWAYVCVHRYMPSHACIPVYVV